MPLFRVYVEEESLKTAEFYVEADTQDEADEQSREISCVLPETAWSDDVIDSDFLVRPIAPIKVVEGIPIWRGGESGGWD